MEAGASVTMGTVFALAGGHGLPIWQSFHSAQFHF